MPDTAPPTPGNPPDQYLVLQLSGSATKDQAAINAQANKGFRFVATLPNNQLLMGNYTS